LRHALQSPAVAPARKRAVISRMAEALSLSGVVRRFLLVLIDHRRTDWLGEIREAFEAVMDDRQGLVRVDVVSARELSAEQRGVLLAELSRVTGRQARAQFSIREELIGGVLARVGSTVFDGSVRGQLETLKQRLTERKPNSPSIGVRGIHYGSDSSGRNRAGTPRGNSELRPGGGGLRSRLGDLGGRRDRPSLRPGEGDGRGTDRVPGTACPASR